LPGRSRARRRRSVGHGWLLRGRSQRVAGARRGHGRVDSRRGAHARSVRDRARALRRAGPIRGRPARGMPPRLRHTLPHRRGCGTWLRRDCAISLTNTWGTMSDKLGVLKEMRRLAPQPRTRLLSVYAAASVLARREWYRRLEHVVLEETDDYLMTEGGFRSEHFSEARLRSLVGECAVRPLAGIAYLVTF